MIPVSFDMLDPTLCVTWRILKLLLKLQFFYGQIFLSLKVYKFHQTMLVLNAFPAISEGLKLNFFGEACPRIALGGSR